MPRKVLLIGWDGADWKVITPLLEAGAMPNLERLLDAGVMGNLATLSPSLSLLLWTSIATGKRPFAHGIVGFTEPDPQRGGVRPVTNLSRKTRALWNIFHLQGMTCNVVGWWPSHPVEPIRGVMVSDHYHQIVGPLDQPWPVRSGTIQPERLIEPLAELRVHPQELVAEHVGPFVPHFAQIDTEKDQRLKSLAKILAECTSIHAAATALIQLEPWDFMAVYYDALDHFSHAFMRYHPPRMENVSEEDFDLYKDVVTGGYRYHDLMLGTLLDLAGEDTTVILVSDHGFHPDHLRPRAVPREPAGPAVQHRAHGILVLNGPGIKRDERIYGANLLDIAPTILTLYGLPVGEDLDGQVLVNAFAEPPQVTTIPSWDDMPGEDGRHPPDLVLDPVEAQESIHQLVALGYIEKPDANRERAVAQALREQRYNTARAYMDAQRHAEALELLEELVAEEPDEYRFHVQRVTCYQALERIPAARAALDELLVRRQENAAQAAEELRAWREEHGEPNWEELEEAQQHELRRLQSEARRNPFAEQYLTAVQLLAEGDPEGALTALERAARMDPETPAVPLKKGEAYLALEQGEEAERSFREALARDPEDPAGYVGLCRALLRRRQNREAAETALTAIGLLYFHPLAHYLLDLALHRMGYIPRAVEALKVALAQNPNFAAAHERLALIYENRLGAPDQAAEHRRLAQEAKERVQALREGPARPRPTEAGRTPVASDQDVLARGQDRFPTDGVPLAEALVVVAGLPRCGSSMLMQMLAAGGLPPLTDGSRPADGNNERGYFEYEAVKSLPQESAWLSQARGHAVKVLGPLLLALPREDGPAYRILFLERDLGEVVASQQDMIRAAGKPGARLSETRLQRVFAQQLQRLRRTVAVLGWPVLYVGHRECIENPAGVAARVNKFLGGSLDEAAMAAAVAPDLYRHRR